jgi:multidrug efflux pump subunit AcrA (membrane-fusion protein)
MSAMESGATETADAGTTTDSGIASDRQAENALQPDPPVVLPQAGNGGDLQSGTGSPVSGQPEPITTGRGVRIGRRAAVITVTIAAVLAAVGFGIYAYVQVPPLTDLSAQVVSNSQIYLGFPQSGILSRVLVHSGEHVAAGQLLAEETVAGLAQQVAADHQAITNDWATIQQLNQLLSEVNTEVSSLSSRPVMTTAPLQVDLANAKSQLLRDHAQLTIATAVAAEGMIRAPVAGTVMSISGQPGEVVTGAGVAGSGSTGGTVSVTPRFELFPAQQSVAGSASASPVVVLATDGPTLVNVVVPETQIRLVHLGNPVTISPTVPGLGSVTGTVTQIFSSSVVAAGVVSYEVQVKVVSHHGEHTLLPGMTATATIRH